MDGNERPGDLLIGGWDSGRDQALDLTMRHPLAASGLWDPNTCQLAEAEAGKNRQYLDQCNSAGVDFAPYA